MVPRGRIVPLTGILKKKLENLMYTYPRENKKKILLRYDS